MMNTEINNNIKNLIEKLGITPYEFSKQIGNKRADNVYNIINEKVEVSPKTLNKILHRFPEYKEFILMGKEDSSMTQKATLYIESTDDLYSITQELNIPEYILREYKEKTKTPTIEHASKLVNYFERIGEAVSEKEDSETVYVSLLPISAQGGSLNDFVVSVKKSDCEKIISPIKGADWAITVSGDSMSPEFPSGAQILIKKINEKAFIDWGKVYVLDTCNGTIIKIIVPSEKEGYVKCISINNDKRYAPFDVSFDDIYGFYRILLCMSVK